MYSQGCFMEGIDCLLKAGTSLTQVIFSVKQMSAEIVYTILNYTENSKTGGQTMKIQMRLFISSPLIWIYINANSIFYIFGSLSVKQCRTLSDSVLGLPCILKTSWNCHAENVSDWNWMQHNWQFYISNPKVWLNMASVWNEWERVFTLNIQRDTIFFPL